MATTNTTYTLTFQLNLVRGGETAKRSLSFEYTGELTEETINSVAQQWLTNFNKLIQPNQWRDSDIAEEEWTTIGITPTSTTKTVVTYDAASANEDEENTPESASGGE